MKDVIAAVGGTGCAVIAAIALCLGLVGLGWGVQNFYLDHIEAHQISQHARNLQHSFGYISSRNDHMGEDITAYDKYAVSLHTIIDPTTQQSIKAAQASLLDDICTFAGELYPSEVSPEVSAFLAEHPCS